MKNLRLFTSIVLIAFISLSMGALFQSPAAGLFFAVGLFAIGFVKGLFQFNTTPEHSFLDGFVINDTTYAGEAASSFIVKAITGNETIQGGHVYVRDGIKKSFTIPRWDADYEDFIQDRATTPVSKGTMTVDGKSLTPADYMIYTEFNPRDYEQHWFATQLNNTLIDRRLPMSVESVVIQEVLKRHDKYSNKQLWNSDSTLASPSIYRYYDGYLKKATAASDTAKITATTLTKTNIQAEFQKGFDLIVPALKYSPDMKYFVSYATYDLYMQSQIAQTYKGVDITKEGVPTFRGKEIVKIADFPDNTYLIAKGMASPESNLWVGMNSTDDAKLELRPLQANSELWFIKMLMKVDVQIGWNNETVLYS